MTVLRARVFDLLCDKRMTADTPTNAARIASQLGVSAIEVIDALDDLETMGLIRRCQRRSKNLPKGGAKVDHLWV